MAKDICIFKRTEKKYIISAAERKALLSEIAPLITPDKYKISTVCSLYLDTDNFLLIRNSIAAKAYKEKLRIRCYGTPALNDKVFFEIKKKFKGVVYKRRVAMPLQVAYDYLKSGVPPQDSQIMREIDYSMRFYGLPKPKALIAYQREAYFVTDQPGVRLTFDNNIRYRTDNLLLENGSEGTNILPEDKFILEIKTEGAMPIWLAHTLDRHKIFPNSFSKYGTAYKNFIIPRQNAENIPKIKELANV